MHFQSSLKKNSYEDRHNAITSLLNQYGCKTVIDELRSHIVNELFEHFPPELRHLKALINKRLYLKRQNDLYENYCKIPMNHFCTLAMINFLNANKFEFGDVLIAYHKSGFTLINFDNLIDKLESVIYELSQ